jgi:hypothetical protein
MEGARIMRFPEAQAVREVSAHDMMLILGGAKVTLTVKIPPLR